MCSVNQFPQFKKKSLDQTENNKLYASMCRCIKPNVKIKGALN